MILCCGEALIDMLPRVTQDGESAFAPHAGGSVFNSAVALGRLGTKTGFFSGLSDDLFGRQLRDRLAESHVDTRFAAISSRPTTLAFVTLAEGHASYLFYDEQTAGRMIGEADLPERGDEATALLFGGISLIPEPCGGAYEALMRREHARCAIMLDPNIRPDFIPDREAHLARMQRMIAMADIVKASEDDLEWFGMGDAAEFAAECFEAGVAIVLATEGSRGVRAFTPRDSVFRAAEAVTVVDTVGAGDTFNAGFLAALDDRRLLDKRSLAGIGAEPLREVLDFAVRAAAVSVTRAGANPPWREELQQPRSIPA